MPADGHPTAGMCGREQHLLLGTVAQDPGGRGQGELDVDVARTSLPR